MSRSGSRNSKAVSPGPIAPSELIVPLLAWYGQNARDLPWRKTNDPYAIWVSEIMLQQTQVQTVVPYYERWLKALPTIHSLATANPQRLHKLWEGLGYYTRVRNMQKAARQIVEQHGGTFPNSHEAVLQLPGIGPYTAGAICSIAFGQHTPILDGNIIRVLTRLRGIRQDPREKRTRDKLWRLAADLVTAASNPSDLNQGLMELGALICTPRSPRCQACPLAPSCYAARTAKQAAFPAFATPAPATKKRVVALAIQRHDRWYVQQRAPGLVNGHLWEFPNLEVAADEKVDLSRLCSQLIGIPCRNLKPICTVRHSITRYRITLEAFAGQLDHPTGSSPQTKTQASEDGTKRKSQAPRWRTLPELNRLPFPSAHKRILQHLAHEHSRRARQI